MKHFSQPLRWLPRRLTLLPAAALLMLCAVPALPQTYAGILPITVRREGIRPSTATIPAGKVLVRVSNRLGKGDLNLQIVNASSAQVAAIDLPPGKWETATQITLAAGTYTIRVANLPSLTATLTVTP
jgi:hypothetical protein